MVQTFFTTTYFFSQDIFTLSSPSAITIENIILRSTDLQKITGVNRDTSATGLYIPYSLAGQIDSWLSTLIVSTNTKIAEAKQYIENLPPDSPTFYDRRHRRKPLPPKNQNLGYYVFPLAF